VFRTLNEQEEKQAGCHGDGMARKGRVYWGIVITGEAARETDLTKTKWPPKLSDKYVRKRDWPYVASSVFAKVEFPND